MLAGNQRCSGQLQEVLSALRGAGPGRRLPARVKRLLRGRILGRGPADDDRIAQPPFSDSATRFITSRHKWRAEASIDRQIADAAANGQTVFLCTAADRIECPTGNEGAALYRALASHPNPNDAKRLPGVLPLRVGHRYILRRVVSRKAKLVPGTEVELLAILGVVDAGDVGGCAPLDRVPDGVVLRVPGATWVGPEGWPAGTFVLRPSNEGRLELTVGGEKLPKFTRLQFPLLPADALTDRGAQGMTIPAVIADLRRQGRAAGEFWISVYQSEGMGCPHIAFPQRSLSRTGGMGASHSFTMVRDAEP